MPLTSMTGFGAASRPLALHDGDDDTALGGTSQRLAVEVRSVNLRFLEIKVRQPFGVAGEERIRQRIKQRGDLGRGRIDVLVHLVHDPAGDALGLDEDGVRHVLLASRRVRELAGELGVEVRPPTALEVLKFVGAPKGAPAGAVSPTPSLPDCLDACLDEALDALGAMRAREGAALEDVIRELAGQLAEQVRGLEDSIEGEDERLQGRLLERVRALCARVDAESPDATRLAQEVAILVQKGDIAEELARIASHLEQLRRIVDAPARRGQGKTLGFLCQELLREITTIGSKITSHRGSALMIGAKGTVERLREQVQNVE